MRGKLDNLNRRHGGTLKIDRWFKVPVNNARLNTMATYYDLVPGFEALLAKNGGDLKKFFDAVGDMRTMTKEERAAHLHALAKKRARS